MLNVADILPEGLTKDEQVELLLSMFESEKRGFAAEIDSLRTAREAEMAAELAAHEAEMAAEAAAHQAEMAAEPAHHETEKARLELQIEDYIIRLKAKARDAYGPSSEKGGQLRIPFFNEIEQAFDPKAIEPTLADGSLSDARHTKKKSRKKAKALDTSKLPAPPSSTC